MALLKRCSLCKRVNQGKPATAYWRWYPNATESVGYRIYYCSDCWRQLVTTINLQLALDFAPDEDTVCGVCGTKALEALELAYLYLYPPRQDRQELIVPTCGTCLNLVVEDVRKHGQRLEDRDGQSAREVVESAWSFVPAA